MQPDGATGPTGPTGVRKTKMRLSVLAFVVVMGPGIALYALLRTVGVGIGGAGLAGLAMMFVGTFVYPMWLFGGGHRKRSVPPSTDETP